MDFEGFVAPMVGRGASFAALLLLAGGCGDDVAGASATEMTGGAAATSGAGVPPPTDDPTAGANTGEDSGASGGASATTGPDPSGTDAGGECPADDPLCALPPEDQAPTDKPDGLPSPIPGVYDDLGVAPLDNGFRALIGFPTRDRPALEARVDALYDPQDPTFRQYLSVQQWMAGHAPREADVALVSAWLGLRGFKVTYTATNRLLVAFSGTVADFNATFQTELHICMRKNPQAGLPPFPVYCTLASFTMPKFVADRTTGVLTADMPADTGELSNENPDTAADHPGPGGLEPRQVARAYGLKPLYDQGFDGDGATLGVIAAGTYHAGDLQIFWNSFGVSRALPTRVSLMEPVVERISETILDTQWSTSLAPGAAVRVYEGPDARNTALLFVFNEAIADNEADVITDSFAHREDSEPAPLRHQYDESALMAAALGITLVSASGDSARPDTPCGSPYVTCVGGTALVCDDDGVVIKESAWSLSGSGDSKSFPVPWWQAGDAPGMTRAVADLALNASAKNPYWVRRYGEWVTWGGTSFASPSFAAIVAVIDGRRKAQGLPRVGMLNRTLYTDPAVRATFRDITSGSTDLHDAGPGWDYPTGLGAPDAAALADALP